MMMPVLSIAQIQNFQLIPNASNAFHDTTWEWTNGNEIFEVKMHDCNFETNEINNGKCMFISYKMISSGTVLYETRPSIINYTGDLPLGGILGAQNDPVPTLYGQIQDETEQSSNYWIEGMLKITYIPCQGVNCIPQISWVISKPKELVKDPTSPDDYNLPTNIILDKTN